MNKPRVGFIGQGYVGKNYADNLEARGFEVIRYALEEPYVQNKDAIKDCDIVFVAVPTPTTESGFDGSAVEGVLPLIGKGKIAVIKSTVIPGFTQKMQEKFPDIVLLFSPEFLSVATARQDVDNPFSNVVGMPSDDETHRAAAKAVHAILPPSPHSLTTLSQNAEIIKYAHNTYAYAKVVMVNMYYDLTARMHGDWNDVQQVLARAPFVGPNHLNPIHKSGRGAGGFCLLKDFAALRDFYEKNAPEDTEGIATLRGIEAKNIRILKESGKDAEIIKDVYGGSI
jgi:UDPglucose 6-dehydrogenase